MCIAFSAFRARYHLEQKQEDNGDAKGDEDDVQDTLVFGKGDKNGNWELQMMPKKNGTSI